MSDEPALLRAIHADPDDDTPRLVYADWLDEHGDPARAEFIRVQIELANREDYATEEYAQLSARGRQIQGTHAAQWLRHLSQFDEAMQDQRIEVGFARGFPEVLSLTGAGAADFAILRCFPSLRHLEVMHSPLTPDVLRDIARLPDLESFTTESTGFDTAWLAHLDTLPCWTHVGILEDLNARAWNAFQERRISKITLLPPDQQRAAAIRYLRATRLNDSVRPNKPVKTVRLVQQRTTDAELRLLSYLPELEEIEIAYGRETAAGLEHLAKLPNLKTVHLGRANTESLVPLMNCASLETLEYFGDAFSRLTDESVVGLERLTGLLHLMLCSVGGTDLRDSTLRRVGALSELRTLNIDLERLDDERSLTALANLTKLESLELNGRQYTGADLQQFLTGLRTQSGEA